MLNEASERRQIAALRAQVTRTPMLQPEEEAGLIESIQAHDDPRALARLIAAHSRMVVAMAARHARRGIALDDLIGEGNLGLVEAARRFDASHAARFSTFAAWWVRARIGRFALQNRRIVAAPSTRGARQLLSSLGTEDRRLLTDPSREVPREAIAARLGVTLDDVELVMAFLRPRDVGVGMREGEVDVVSECLPPDEELASHEARRQAGEDVARALGELDARERDIVRRRLLEDEPETLAAIGARHGLSRERVRQLETRAHQKLRGSLVTHAMTG